MTKQEIFTFISTNPVGFVATLENKRPRVKAILMCWADEDGIVFNTGKMKDFYKQLAENTKVEICFYNPKDNIQIRVSGRAELQNDMDMKKRIVAKFDFLKPWVERNGYGFMAPFRVKNAKATVWTFTANFEPKTDINL